MASEELPLKQGVHLNYLFPVMKWEEKFDLPAVQRSFGEHWKLPFFLVFFFYLPALYIGQKIMRNREPLNVKIPMALWNTGLAIFSFITFTRVIPEVIYSLNISFYHSICSDSYIYEAPSVYWGHLFVLSKLPELGDTFFLVMRKQKLIFLHVYHHATVLLFCWFLNAQYSATIRWYIVMNSAIHTVMYAYFALKAFPELIRIPRWISIIITVFQTFQMVIGAFISAAAYYTKLSGRKCAVSHSVSIISLILYISYLFLFSKFFQDSYFTPRPKAEKKHV